MRKQIKILYAFIIVLIGMSMEAPRLPVSVTYYVSNTGSDAANGTSSSTPWQTISKINSSTFNAGDIILLKRGDTWREQLTLPSSGAAGNNITLDAYGSGALPIINAADLKNSGWTNSGTNVWWIAAPSLDLVFGGYMVIYNGNICTAVGSTGALTTANTYFLDVAPTPDRIYVYSTTDPGTQTVEITARMYGVVTAAGASSKHHWTIRNVDARYAGRGGFYFEGPGESTSDHLLGGTIVEYCNAYANRVQGMAAYDHYDSTIWRYNTSTYNGNAYYAWVADEAWFNHNSSAHSIWYTSGAITDGHGIGGYQSDNWLVEYNTSDDDADEMHIDCGHLGLTFIMRYNVCKNSQFGVSGNPNTPNMGYGNLAAGGHGKIYYNVWINGASSFIEAYSAQLAPVDIYNNTGYTDLTHCTDGATYFASGMANVNFKNNLLTREYVSTEYTFVDLNSVNAATLDYNNYFFFNGSGTTMRNYFNGTTNTTISSWRTTTGKETNSTNVDPLFVANTTDWHLQSSSPMINAGVDVGLTVDIDGNPIVGNPDIGAYEYTAPTGNIQVRGHRAVVQ